VGVDHPNYQTTLDPVAPAVRESLVKDLRFEAAWSAALGKKFGRI